MILVSSVWNLISGVAARILDTSVLGADVRDLFDILIVSVLLYAVLILLKRTHSLFLFNGVGILIIIYLLARTFSFYLTNLLFNFFLSFFVIIFVVVFQREFRHFFEWLSVWRRLPASRRETIPEVVAGQIVQAVKQLAQRKTGALIVFPGDEPLERWLDGGIALNGKVSIPILLSIFDPTSPGHDGAVVITGDRIKAFGVHLPLADRLDDVKEFGTRHRAALGLSERTDALITAVSEERGSISIAEEGSFKTLKDVEQLRDRLQDFLREHLLLDSSEDSGIPFSKNLREKAIALCMALVLWYVFVVQLGAGTTTREYDIPIEFRSIAREMVIDQVAPTEVSVSLAGSSQDFNFLNPDNLVVTINAANLPEGWHKVTIDENQVANRPHRLSTVKVSPKTIQFHITKNAP